MTRVRIRDILEILAQYDVKHEEIQGLDGQVFYEERLIKLNPWQTPARI